MIWILLGLACSGESPDSPVVPVGTPATPHRGGPASQVTQGGFSVAPNFELLGTVSDSPRSIVLISLDTVRADHLSTYGGQARVANLDAVAAAGVVFEQAISTGTPRTMGQILRNCIGRCVN